MRELFDEPTHRWGMSNQVLDTAQFSLAEALNICYNNGVTHA